MSLLSFVADAERKMEENNGGYEAKRKSSTWKYHTLFVELRLHDREYFFRYHEFPPYDFNHWNTFREKNTPEHQINWQHFQSPYFVHWHAVPRDILAPFFLSSAILKVRNCGKNWVVTSYIASQISADDVHINFHRRQSPACLRSWNQLNFAGKLTVNVWDRLCVGDKCSHRA